MMTATELLAWLQDLVDTHGPEIIVAIDEKGRKLEAEGDGFWIEVGTWPV